jgi:hypothetical protein
MVAAFMQFLRPERGNHAVWLRSGVVPLGPKRFLFLVRRSTELASSAALRWNDMNAASTPYEPERSGDGARINWSR